MIYLPAHLLILFGLIWLLVRTEKPFLCSGIYAGAHMFFSLLLEVQWWLILFLGIIAFGLASLIFGCCLASKREAGFGGPYCWVEF
jgi:hypothetical protein